MFAAVVGVTARWLWFSSSSGESTFRTSSVAVLPLRNLSEDPESSDYLAEGITQAVTTKLVQAGLRVTPHETARRLRERDEAPQQIGGALNVDAVLEGAVQLAGDRIRTTLSLVDAQSGLIVWAEEFDDSYDDVFALQTRIATGVAASLSRELTVDEAATLETPEARSVEAYDAYLQGAHLMQEETRESTDVALQYFTRAVELDPTLVDAHVGIGAVHFSRYVSGWGGSPQNLDLAETSFHAALRLNPASMRARRGLILLYFRKGLSEACLLQGQEARRLGAPRDIETLMVQADAYVSAGLEAEAIPFQRQVMALDPLNAWAPAYFTVAAPAVGEFRQVLDVSGEVLRTFGQDVMVLTERGFAHHKLGDADRAQAEYARALDQGLRAGSLGDLRAAFFSGALYAQTGEREQAEAIWSEALERVDLALEQDPDNVGMRLQLASLYGFLGQRERFRVEENRALDGIAFSPWEIFFAAGAHAVLGETERALELLNRHVELGGLGSRWEVNLSVLAPSFVESAAFGEFRRAHDALRQRLRTRYVPAD